MSDTRAKKIASGRKKGQESSYLQYLQMCTVKKVAWKCTYVNKRDETVSQSDISVWRNENKTMKDKCVGGNRFCISRAFMFMKYFYVHILPFFSLTCKMWCTIECKM